MLEFAGLILFLIGCIVWFYYTRRTVWQGAPFVPLESDVIAEALRIARVKEGDAFYDLGSGDGRVVIAAAQKGAQAVGVEIDRLRVLYSRLWIRLFGLGKKATILEKNIFDIDLRDADVVFLYLLQGTNNRIEEKLARELKQGARVVSIAFHFPHWKPKEISPIGPAYGPIYYYER